MDGVFFEKVVGETGLTEDVFRERIQARLHENLREKASGMPKGKQFPLSLNVLNLNFLTAWLNGRQGPCGKTWPKGSKRKPV